MRDAAHLGQEVAERQTRPKVPPVEKRRYWAPELTWFMVGYALGALIAGTLVWNALR
jgi:hypothetical protein